MELDIKNSTKKEDKDVITSSLMSGINFIIMVGKYIENIRTSPKLSTLFKETYLSLKIGLLISNHHRSHSIGNTLLR